MHLLTGYARIVADGAQALGAIAVRARAHAEQNPALPELWLHVRDFAGLAGRLAETGAQEWEDGFARLLFVGQDIGVLDDLRLTEAGLDSARPYEVLKREAAALHKLRTFLCDCLDGRYDRMP